MGGVGETSQEREDAGRGRERRATNGETFAASRAVVERE
jgi:hypothetical protein